MISIIVYGRNDAHGYNLHKRAAISLNTMGELLVDEADEIVFVDYNSPDELPTFPEAIRDTLSSKVRRLLRVIRVRPAFHLRCCGVRTHLAAIEPIARNVALRRTKPENRWVLSTNTDMVFVPHVRGGSLSDICRSLDDGFYQLPRFELPETIWESFDRLDGAQAIERVRDLSRRFHLDEVVPHKVAVFDGPGDFQMAARGDLFDIFGFDEDMILGWHVDANLTVRMRLKRGVVSSADRHLRGYHCDHTRLPSLYHAADAPENDWGVFVRGVTQAECLKQAENWGYPGETFEEFALDAGERFIPYAAALAEAIPQAQTAEYLCPYTEDPFEIQDYPVEHVLPFLIDLVATLPPGATIFYSGVTLSLLDRLVVALPRIVEGVRIVVLRDAPCIEDVISSDPVVTVGDLPECLDAADMLVFEFAAGSTQARSVSRWAPADRDRLARVERAFLAAIDHEHDRLAGEVHNPRRFVGVNATRNIFERMLQTHLDCARTPLSTRVRSGIVRGRAGGQKGDWRAYALRQRMRRRWLPPPSELRTLDALAEAWLRTAPVDAATSAALLESHRTPLAALVAIAGYEPDGADTLAAALRGIPAVPGDTAAREEHDPLPAGGGLLDLYDWEDPAWFRFVRRHMRGADATDWFARSPWIWERATILRLLDMHGMLEPRCRVLSCGWAADDLAIFTAQHATVIRARLSLDGASPLTAPPDSWAVGNDLYDSARLIQWTKNERAPFDAIIAPRHALLSLGGHSLRLLLKGLWPLLKPRGKVIFSGLVDIGPSRAEGHLRLADLQQAGDFGWPHPVPGYHAETPMRLRVSASSIERRRDLAVAGRDVPRTVDAVDDTVLLKGVFVFTRLASRDRPGC